MTISESLLVALFTMLMVFGLLASVFLLVKLLSFVMTVLPKKRAKQIPVPMQAAEAPIPVVQDEFSAGNLRLRDVDEPTAAMIMAIVSDESGIPLSELCFKSIRLQTKKA